MLFRKGVIAVLQNSRPAWTMIEASNGEEAIKTVALDPPDVVLMDVQMPVMSGIEATKAIKRSAPDLPIIIITQFEETSLILHFLGLGVNGFMSKNSDPEQLVGAIELVLTSGKFVNQQMLKAMEVSIGKTPSSRVKLDLSLRDREIIYLLRQGKNTKEIASDLHLSEASIESYRKDLLHKTKTHNVAELVSFAHRTGLI